MALISCPECKRQVSDKAVSCPECGYPLREAMAVLITGPNGIPLLEGLVREFDSFIEWIFGVKLKKDDGDFIRQVLIEEWSHNDQSAFMFQTTSVLLKEAFEARTRLELGEEGHSDTRDYWRQALMHDLDLTAFGSLPGILHKMAERLKVEPARNRLRPTSYIGSRVADLLVFITRKVYDIPGEGTPEVLTSYWEKEFADADDGDQSGLIERYLMSLFQKESWPQLSEADRSKFTELWGQDEPLGLLLEATRGILQRWEEQFPTATSDREDFGQAQAPKSQNASLSDVLVGKQWQARSQTLAGQGLVIAFMRNGEFTGQLTGASYTTPAQPVKGKWQVIESQLFLDYVYNAQADTGFTVQVIPTSAQIQIHITQASASRLLGVDQFARAWEWERIG